MMEQELNVYLELKSLKEIKTEELTNQKKKE